MNREKKMPPPAATYETGYCKPPAHTRFKPGQSGNPKGRPKREKNLAGELSQILSKKLKVTIDGKVQTISLSGAIMMGQAMKAAKGDTKAASLIGSFARSAGLLAPAGNASQSGGVLLVPKPLTVEEWRAMMAEKHRQREEDDE